MARDTKLEGVPVFVGLSGGVDSAVTAALLQEAGAQVTGVFIQGWYPPGMPCTWAEDRRDAMRVAAHLRIPFRTLDASAEYKRGVIDYLLDEYKAGRTPNPDIMCNRDVKFGAFHRYAKHEGAQHIATGHYARALDGHLFRGKDAGKDQSYFLWAVPRAALADTLFPLGEMHKEEVRKRARAYQLPVAEKKDSQGICFLGSISVEDFLTQEFHPEQGVALDDKGAEIGRHDGAVLYTLGQRIPLTKALPGPWYVIKKDLATNTLVVSKERSLPAPPQNIRLRETNWFNGTSEGAVLAQHRYHGPVVSGTYAHDSFAFTPDAPLLETVATGQSLVLYRDDECLGGGIIS